jgi:iron-sulfur cluster insertion protein
MAEQVNHIQKVQNLIPNPNGEFPFTITDSAAHKIFELIQEEGNPNLKLRVYITGGGCSGFQYGFMFDETVNEDDVLINRYLFFLQDFESKTDDEEDEGDDGDGDEGSGSITLLIDSISRNYLKGALLDYKNTLGSEHFIIRNPNAKSSCRCGASFNA